MRKSDVATLRLGGKPNCRFPGEFSRKGAKAQRSKAADSSLLAHSPGLSSFKRFQTLESSRRDHECFATYFVNVTNKESKKSVSSAQSAASECGVAIRELNTSVLNRTTKRRGSRMIDRRAFCLVGGTNYETNPLKFFGSAVKPGKILSRLLFPRCRLATSAKTSRKSVVTAKSRPS